MATNEKKTQTEQGTALNEQDIVYNRFLVCFDPGEPRLVTLQALPTFLGTLGV